MKFFKLKFNSTYYAFLLALIYVEETLAECDLEYLYQVNVHGNLCTHRRYNCTGVTNEMITHFHKNHYEEPCRADNYCYTVYITNSQLHDIDDKILLTNNTCTSSHLYGLILTNDHIQNLNENVFGVSSTWNIYEIRELKLDQNKLTYVEAFTFMYLRKLKILDLSYNQLVSIGNASYNFPWLEQLFLNHNNISELNDVFEKLTNLQILDISFNQITVIEGNIFRNTKKLEKLSMKHNRIRQLEEGVFHELSSLKEIDLAENYLQSFLPNTFEDLQSLLKLDLTKNEITVIGQNTFFGLTKLQNLFLAENQIQKITLGAFQYSSSLQDLRLDENFISELEIGLFSNLGELNYLNLSNNRLKELDDGVLFPLHHLTVLDLDNNDLSYIDYSALLSHLPKLKHVRINQNNWTCSSLIEMFKAFRARGVDYAMNSMKQFTRQNIYGLPCEEGVQEIDNDLKISESLANLSRMITNIEEKIDLVPYNTSKQFQSYELLNNIRNISFSMMGLLRNAEVLKQIDSNMRALNRNIIEMYTSIHNASKSVGNTEEDSYKSKIGFYFIITIFILSLLLIVTCSIIILKCIKCNQRKDIGRAIQMDLIDNEI